MAFNPLSNPLDYIVLAGERSPGVATISGAGSPRKWEKRASYAYGGAIVVYRGIDLAAFTVTLSFTTEQHWQDWAAFRLLLHRPPQPNIGAGIERISPFGRRPSALDIWHPIVADLNITSVVVLDVLQPVQVADGEWSVDVKFQEYRRPRFALSRPDGSQDEPVSENQREIQALRRQAGSLAAELDE